MFMGRAYRGPLDGHERRAGLRIRAEGSLMSTPVLRRFPFVLAVVAALWCVWIGVLVWTTPVIMEGITAQTAEEVGQPPTRLREVRSFSDMSALGPLPLAIPVLLAAGAALISRLRAPGLLAPGVGLFLGYVLITGFSIGGAYHGPAALLGVALLAELVLSWREGRRPAEA
jgi:hypothetical protein